MKKLGIKRIGNKGFSLVELLITVAVLSIVIVAVGGAMVVSAKSFSSGSSNVTIQQEAQTTTNLLSNLVMDAQKVTQTGATTGTDDGTIEIIGSDGATITVTYSNADKKLSYSKALGGSVESGTLAEGVSFFKVDSSSFATDKNVYFDLGVVDYADNNTFSTTFTATSRNEEKITTGADSAVIVIDTAIIIEPGQTITLPYSVITGGTVTDSTVNPAPVMSGNTDATFTKATISSSNVTITCSSYETAAQFYVKLSTNAVTDAGIPYDTKTVLCKVRRIAGISMTGPSTGAGAVGDTYTVTANMDATNGPKESTFATDSDYVDPYPVTYTYTMKDAAGNVVPYSSYISITEGASSENNKTEIRVVNAIPNGYTLTVTTVAQHPAGANKTSTVYGDVKSSFTILMNGVGDTPGGPSPIEPPDSGVKRGDDCIFKVNIDMLPKSNYGYWYFRYREIHSDGSKGAWTPFVPAKDRSHETQKINAVETFLFKAFSEYDLQYVYVIYDPSSKEIVWPKYLALLNEESVFKRDGYKFSDNPAEKIKMLDGPSAALPGDPNAFITDTNVFGSIMQIPAIKSVINTDTDDFNLEANEAKGFVQTSVPEFDKGADKVFELIHESDGTIQGLSKNYAPNNVKLYFQKWSGSAWMNISSPQFSWFKLTGFNNFSNNNGTGRYRFCLMMDSGVANQFLTIDYANTTIENLTYSSQPCTDNIMGDLSTGDRFIEFKIK